MNKMNICYIWDEKLLEQCNRLPAVKDRAILVHDLLESYMLIRKVTVVRSSPATFKDLREFHSELYLDHLKSFLEVDEDYMTSTEDEQHGIGYDCPPVSNMYELVSHIAGGSLTAAKCLMLGLAEIAINWCGGWHHAHRFGAEGFCYINDIVIAIEILRKKFPRILYIDLDVHHGNGVQDAYSLSKSVFTLSFHKYEAGFYPGTGSVDDIGSLSAAGYACNMPLYSAYSDDTMEYVFERVFSMVMRHFTADAIVIQCGADALAGDPNGGANLTTRSYCNCIRTVLDKRKPTMLLGGGGYNHANTARLWASITAMITGEELNEEIPEHSQWLEYGPTYTIAVEPTLVKDNNTKSYIESIIGKIKENLEKHLTITNDEEPKTKKFKAEKSDIFNENKVVPKLGINRSNTRINHYSEGKPNYINNQTSTEIVSNNVGNVYDFAE